MSKEDRFCKTDHIKIPRLFNKEKYITDKVDISVMSQDEKSSLSKSIVKQY